MDAAETGVDAALVFLVVGGGWATLDRPGLRPLGFSALLVRLTAVHFHDAAVALPVLAGLVGRARPGGLPRAVAAGVLLGVPLVAGGLSLSQVTGLAAWETGPAWLLAGAAAAVGGLQVGEGLRRRDRVGAPLALSGLSLAGGMVLPGAALLSLVRFDQGPDGGLSVRTDPAPGGDAGFYLLTPLGPLRLPFRESLDLGPLAAVADPAVPGATLGAVQTLALGPVRLLELDYRLRPPA